MSELTPYQPNELAPADLMTRAGQAANQVAARSVFEDYTSRKAANTLRRQRADLDCFAGFLRSAHLTPGDLAHDPESWRGITWGIIEAFKRWMLAQGFAVSTVNYRLSTVKIYAGLGAKAGTVTQAEAAMIRQVDGYAHREIRHVDELREEEGAQTRRGSKKAQAVSITPDQARKLKSQPDTPQGRRDAVLMCILLDHGLRCGEVAQLQVESFDLKAGTMIFYRPKVNKVQTHRLTRATLEALRPYLETDQTTPAGPLLLASRKRGHKGEAGGKLAGVGMTERAITKRVEWLGELAGVSGLSAHDCRHYWATQAARHKTPMDRLKDAGGWSSIVMPARYIEAAKVANEGVILGSD